MSNRGRNTGGTPYWVVVGAAAIIGFIALYQTVFGHGPDSYIIGALLALALGGGVGRLADGVLTAYAQAQGAEVVRPPDPPIAPTPPGLHDEA